MKKRILGIIWIWIVTCMMTLTGCGLLPKEEELPMAPLLLEGETEDYVVSQVVRGDVVIQEQIRASYVPSSTEKLGFELGDEKISKVYVSVGDSIKAGDVLMELDVRRLHDVNVVGVKEGENIQVNPDPAEPLKDGIVLILIGSNEALEQFGRKQVKQ